MNILTPFNRFYGKDSEKVKRFHVNCTKVKKSMVEHFYLVPLAQPSAVALQHCLLASSGPHSSVPVEGKTFSNSVLSLSWAAGLLQENENSSDSSSRVAQQKSLSFFWAQLHCARLCNTTQLSSTQLHCSKVRWATFNSTQPSPVAQNRKFCLSLSTVLASLGNSTELEQNKKNNFNTAKQGRAAQWTDRLYSAFLSPT